MSEVWTMGELLVEIMRPRPGMSLAEPGEFLGPFPSGAPGIFIDTVARLGHGAAIIGGVGEDDFGRCILERFRRDGVRTELVEVFPGRSTGVAFVAYSPDGSRRFIFHWDGTPAVMAAVPDPRRIGTPAVFHVMGCSLMANEEFRRRLLRTVEIFAGRGARITFDPNIRFELPGAQEIGEIVEPVLRRCSVLFPGERELQILGGKGAPDEAAAALFARHPVEIIVLKQGRLGCTVYTPGEKLRIPAFPVPELDPTGAGDCFDAGFVCGLLEGRSLRESARLAAAAGALNAQAFGPMEGAINPQNVARLLTGVRVV